MYLLLAASAARSMRMTYPSFEYVILQEDKKQVLHCT